MPSGWMPGARHDKRAALRFGARRDTGRVPQPTTPQLSGRRTAHRHAHRPRAIAHG